MRTIVVINIYADFDWRKKLKVFLEMSQTPSILKNTLFKIYIGYTFLSLKLDTKFVLNQNGINVYS